MIKGYIALFVCFVTRPVNTNVVTSLSTEALLAALIRMFARREKPRTICSDIGTNLQGAANELYAIYKLCAFYDYPLNPTYLSPGHFLIGEPLTQLTAADFTDVKSNRISGGEPTKNNCKNSGNVGHQIPPEAATASTLAEEIP